MTHRAFDVRWPPIRDALADTNPSSILDVGCADGDFARAMSYAAPVTAVDKRDHGWDDHPNVTWTVTEVDATTVRAFDGHDAVVALSVLHHLPDWRDVLPALVDVAGRLLLVEVPHPDERLRFPAARFELPKLAAAVDALEGRPLVDSPATRQPVLPRTVYAVDL